MKTKSWSFAGEACHSVRAASSQPHHGARRGETPALTLTLSPREREQPLHTSSNSEGNRAEVSRSFAKTRGAILPTAIELAETQKLRKARSLRFLFEFMSFGLNPNSFIGIAFLNSTAVAILSLRSFGRRGEGRGEVRSSRIGWTQNGAHGVTRPTCLALLLGFILLHSSFCLPASGQSYSVSSHTIAGGGGSSTNGQFTIAATIGQHDASNALTNGQYSVTGGFWVLPQAVQTPGAPTLTIAPATPGNATISWTPSTPGFVLQENSDLSTTNWINSPSGATNPITVPATAVPGKFYRLFKP